MIPKPLIRVFAEITAAVSDRMTGYYDEEQTQPKGLTALKPCYIFNVSYHPGHVVEIQKQILNWKQSDEHAKLTFPCILLLEDIAIGYQGEYPTATVTLFVVNVTEPQWTTQQRQDKNFDPILDPIYEELMKEIQNNKAFSVYDPAIDLRHTKIDHKFWGSAEGGEQNRLASNYVDCIEIRDLTLKLNLKNCK